MIKMKVSHSRLKQTCSERSESIKQIKIIRIWIHRIGISLIHLISCEVISCSSWDVIPDEQTLRRGRLPSSVALIVAV